MTYRMASVISADGSTIRYREFGRGPGVVLLHGGLQSAQNFTRLAEGLAGSLTVYVPNRRGRGGSGSFGPGYGLDTERADLRALLRQTGARRVFGLSSGALIALHAARTLDEIDQLAVYEPPLKTARADPTSWVPRYQRELDRGRLASAMVTAMKGTGDVGPLTYTPRALLVPLVALALRVSKRAVHRDHVAIADLIPTLHFDARLAREAEGTLETFATIRAEVMLLGGNRSARPLRVALDELAAQLPRAKRVELKGIGHLAADESGRPAEVARILRGFFGDVPVA
jgi:pimeloyl-ACP methyl ester carboxylesterase